jgi:hypothetical protein|tara:strand:- start:316 stop:456 length:141 start_codon:yes stop_codon:yes gene_type:complete
MKKEQSYTNDYIIYFIEKWFKGRRSMSKENYQMMKEMVWFMREKKK